MFPLIVVPVAEVAPLLSIDRSGMVALSTVAPGYGVAVALDLGTESAVAVSNWVGVPDVVVAVVSN